MEENYLVQHHTKSEYSPHEATIRLQTKLMENVNSKMKAFIKPDVVHRYAKAVGKHWSQLSKASLCCGFSQGLFAQLRALEDTQQDAAYVDGLEASDGGGSRPPAGVHPPERRPKSVQRQKRLEEDTRMRPVDHNDTTIGRVERVPGTGTGRYRLRLEDGSLSSKHYRAAELEETRFDPQTDLPRWARP